MRAWAPSGAAKAKNKLPGEALPYLEKALQAPPRPGRQIADTGRREEVRALLAKLGISARQLLRTGEDEYKALGLADASLSEAQLIAAIAAHPPALPTSSFPIGFPLPTLGFIDVALFAASRMFGLIEAGTAVTLDLSTQFIGVGRMGQPLDAEVELLRETRRLIFMRGLVVQGEVKVAAFAGTIRKSVGAGLAEG